MSWNMYQILAITAVHCKSDRDDLQFLYSWYGTTHHTLRGMPADDPTIGLSDGLRKRCNYLRS